MVRMLNVFLPLLALCLIFVVTRIGVIEVVSYRIRVKSLSELYWMVYLQIVFPLGAEGKKVQAPLESLTPYHTVLFIDIHRRSFTPISTYSYSRDMVLSGDLINLDGELRCSISEQDEGRTNHCKRLTNALAVDHSEEDHYVASWAGDRLILLADFGDLPANILSYKEAQRFQKTLFSKYLFEWVDWPKSPPSQPKDASRRALVNISKQEYIDQETLDAHTLAIKKRTGLNWDMTMADALMCRISWAHKHWRPNSSSYYGFRHKSGSITILNRGIWAGDRFTYRILTQEEVSTLKDVSAEVCLELEAIWTSGLEYLPPRRKAVGIWFQNQNSTIYAPKKACKKGRAVEQNFDIGYEVTQLRQDPSMFFRADVHPKHLPEEVLAEIITLAAWSFKTSDLPQDVIQPSNLVLINCSHVTRSWRSAALNKRSLWTYINSGSRWSHFKEFIFRSGNMPLTIIVKEVRSPRFWKAVSLVSHRWKTLRFLPTTRQSDHLQDLYYQKITDRFSFDLRVLSQLYIAVNAVPLGSTFGCLLLSAPCLKDLKITTSCLNWFGANGKKGTTPSRFQYLGDWGDMRKNILRCFDLSTLTEVSFAGPENYLFIGSLDPASVEAFRFPNVNTLTLRDGFRNYFIKSFPNISCLAIRQLRPPTIFTPVGIIFCSLRDHFLNKPGMCLCGQYSSNQMGSQFSVKEGQTRLLGDGVPAWPKMDTLKIEQGPTGWNQGFSVSRDLRDLAEDRKALEVPLKRIFISGPSDGKLSWIKNKVFPEMDIEILKWETGDWSGC